jgi:hypothetical protein
VVAVAEQRTAVAAAESDEPNRSSHAEDTDKGRYREHERRHRAASGPQALSVWTTAQATGPVQRRGRYVSESVKHPARMLPAIAAHAYTSPGDLVLDPMCGIGTTHRRDRLFLLYLDTSDRGGGDHRMHRREAAPPVDQEPNHCA